MVTFRLLNHAQKAKKHILRKVSNSFPSSNRGQTNPVSAKSPRRGVVHKETCERNCPRQKRLKCFVLACCDLHVLSC